MITFFLFLVGSIHNQTVFRGGLGYLLGDFLRHYGGDAVFIVLDAEARHKFRHNLGVAGVRYLLIKKEFAHGRQVGHAAIPFKIKEKSVAVGIYFVVHCLIQHFVIVYQVLYVEGIFPIESVAAHHPLYFEIGEGATRFVVGQVARYRMKQGVLSARKPLFVGYPIEGIGGPIVVLRAWPIQVQEVYGRFIEVFEVVLVAAQIYQDVFELVQAIGVIEGFVTGLRRELAFQYAYPSFEGVYGFPKLGHKGNVAIAGVHHFPSFFVILGAIYASYFFQIYVAFQLGFQILLITKRVIRYGFKGFQLVVFGLEGIEAGLAIGQFAAFEGVEAVFVLAVQDVVGHKFKVGLGWVA